MGIKGGLHPDTQQSCLEAALAYLRKGLSVIPIKAGTKTPAVRWTAYQEQPADEPQIREWYSRCDHGVAVITGPASGNVGVRDFDADGAYASWATKYPSFAKSLPTAATGRQGCYHVWFRSTPEVLAEVRQEHSRNGTGAISLGDGELRWGPGCYVLVPPSRHPNGQLYRWIVPLGDEVPILDPRKAGLTTCWAPETGNGASPSLPPASPDTEDTANTSHSVSTVSVDEVLAREGDRIERVVRESQPPGPGRRNRQVFELARGLKAVPGLADANPDDLKPIVQLWHSRALPNIETKGFTETWIDFLRAWPRVRSPKGAAVAAAMQRALRAPMPRAAEQYEEEPLQKLVMLCRQLALESGNGVFYLSCRSAGDVLGASRFQANNWLFLLDHDGVVKQLNKGSRWLAAEYRYLAD